MRSTRKRSFRRRASTRVGWKVATRAANRVINKRSETKRFITVGENYSNGIGGTGFFQWSTRNVFNPLTAGDLDTNVEGSMLDRAMLVIRGQMSANWEAIRLSNASGDLVGLIWHVAVIATNDQLPISDITRAAVPEWFLSSVPWRPRMDGHHVRVLKWKTYTMMPQGMGTITEAGGTPLATNTWGIQDRAFKMTVRFKGKKQYEENPGTTLDFLKGWNYYILTGWGMSGNSAWTGTELNKPNLNMDTYLYFKDF